jgi:excisionase family DNA binding protein
MHSIRCARHFRPMDPDDLISFSDAARKIGCSRTTLYRAVDDGRLNDIEVGGRRMLLRDEAWDKFEPRLKGGRVRKLSDEEE